MPKRSSGEGTIYKRSDGTWAAQLSVPGGRRKTYYARTQREVQTKLQAARRALQEGTLVLAPSQTVEHYLTRWLEDVGRVSVRPRTYEAADLNVRRLVPHVGRLRLESLTPQVMQSAYGRLLGAGLSRRSVEQAHEVLHRAMRQAVLWGLLGRNPCDAVSVPRPDRREMRTLSETELRRLFAVTADHRLHAAWVVLATTGLRLGEALGLGWSDVDQAAGRLSVRRALQRQRGGGFAFVEPKTSRSRRVVHLAPSVVAVLGAHERRQLEERERAGDRWSDHELVFCTMAGRPLKDTYMSAVFHDALRRAELPRVRIHDLRHTAATHLLWRGVHPKVVQELLGHSTISVTLDLYSQVVPALHVEVAGHMEVLFREVDDAAADDANAADAAAESG